MWKNYLAIIYRNILRQKLNTFINILGLAAGISAASLIFLYVHTELKFDESWDNADELYRVNETFEYFRKESTPYALTSHVLGKRMRSEFPDMQVCRLETGDYGNNIFVDDKWLNPGRIKHADDNFFKLFTYPQTVFTTRTDTLPKAWIAKKKYEKYFEPFNTKTFRYGEKWYELAGTFNKSGYQSHLDIDLIVPYDSLILNDYKHTQDWTRLNTLTYVRTDLGAGKLEQLINQRLKNEVDAFTRKHNMQMNLHFPAISLPEIHFNHVYQYDSLSNRDKNVVWLFSIIGILILTIASINYINMAIAQGGIRAREIAIRKTMGATRKNVIIQFLGESVAITLLAIIISVIFTEMLFPAFNEITGFDFHIFESAVLSRLVVFLSVVWLLLGFLSGFYPAFVLSLFQPITIFRGGADLMLYRNVRSYFVSSTKVRKLMLVAQYLVAGTIIIATIIIQLQTNYLVNRDMGFDMDKLVIMELEKDSTRAPQYRSLLNAVLELDNVEKATLAERVPGLRTGRLLFYFESDSGRYQNGFNVFSGRPDYLEVLGCEVVAGRWFDPSARKGELRNEILVNEAFVETMGWSQPLGKEFASGFSDEHKVVGVVKDFNYYSLHQNIEPLAILPNIFTNRYLVINARDPKELMNSGKLEHLWSGFFPNQVPTINRLRNTFNSQYTHEHRLLSIFAYFSGLSIIISSLGLFALSAFSAQKRSREISIRKILGAGHKHILGLLYVDYMQIFAIAILLAWLGAFVFANQWLDTFVAAVSPGLLPYILGSVFILGIVAVTVSYHTLKATRTNPAVFLKYE
ncbi:MAG TPA: FtsX-like permease family protein [Salinivirga sp.]|uniref:ABC transporter permease n=1 Tax=Salinivirga sp. TaxID=1970192 RepID=UPI002B490FA5|nr:FtsX-like permease family protein [Salinivirga sp.]HKK60546.1 FtsX-like permease family protein [Salinivirga sp.]